MTESTGHQAIADHLRAAIRAGEYGPGHQLPSARVLTERFKVARGTVGAAMNQLVREGLVESRPRTGWFVVESKELQLVYRTRVDRAEPYAVERVEARPASREEAQRYGTSPGAPVLVVTRVPLVDGLEDEAQAERKVFAHARLVYEV